MEKYAQNIDDVLAEASARTKSFVSKTCMQQLLGRLLFAMRAGIPAMWRDFVGLLAILSQAWSENFVTLTPAAIAILTDMRRRLFQENGTPLWSYSPRPQEDGRATLVSYTDASRKGKFPKVTAAGWGGFVCDTRTRRVKYFHGRWDPQHVQAAGLDINTLDHLHK